LPERELPPLWLALVPLAVLVALVAGVVAVFGSDSLSGASQVALLLASGCCLSVGFATGHVTWRDFERQLEGKVASVSQAFVILLFIGALSGAWMISGVVPLLICYGMEVMHPLWFLVSSCFICAVVSVLTGSSWTTIATIGVALMGIGQALGFGEGWIAGAIISGAYFGDKISPMSDTTVLASSVIGTPLFTHIRYMMLTTVPTFLITLAVFTVAGFLHNAQGAQDGALVQHALRSTFNLSPWLLAVPVVTGLMIARRLPSAVVLFLGALVACGFALAFQDRLLDQIGGEGFGTLVRRFRGIMVTVYGSTAIDTGVPALNDLVATRGMSGMLGTIWLIMCALIFGAAMDATRMLQRIMQTLLRLARGVTSLVASTAFTGFFLNLFTADQYLSILLTGNMFAKAYDEKGLERRLLSRTAEDSATVTSVLVPWNTCGMAQSSVLGVSTFAYAPYCFFNLLSPLMTIFVAFTGWHIVKSPQRKES